VLSNFSRTSTLPFSNTKKSIKQIARELNVGSVMETSMSRVGDKITLRLKLFKVDPKEQMMWSKKFESTLEEIPNLYKEITKSVVNSLDTQISREEKRSLSERVLYKPEAYEAILKGDYYSGLLTRKGFNDAEIQYLKASELDSNLAARSYAGLALIWLSKRQMGYVPSIEGAKKVEEYFNKQVEIDSTSRVIEAGIMTWLKYDFEHADMAFQYEIDQVPNNANLRSAYAHYLMIMGRMDEAWDQMNTAISIDPLSPWVLSFSAVLYVGDGKLITAAKKFETLTELVPDHPISMEQLLRKYHLFNEKNKAINQIKKINSHLHDINLDDFIDDNYRKIGYSETVRSVADTLSSLYENDIQYVPPYRIHQLYELVDDQDNCIKWMEEMYRIKSGQLPYFSIKGFRKYSDDPRYIAIMEKMGLW
jgi:tetratricopeptide (TPR) repeat protein